MKNKCILIAILLLIPSILMAAPTISSTSGTPGDGNSLTITGANFGTQPHSKPSAYADFEGPSDDPDSSLGQKSSWDAIQFATATNASVFEGSYSLESQPGWESADGGIFRVRTDMSLPAETKAIIAWWRRATYTVGEDDNWKWIRIWSPNDGDNYPNWYQGHTTGDWSLTFVEDCPTETHQKSISYTAPNSTWKHDEYLIQIESAVGNYDGSWQIISDGTVEISTNAWDFNCSGQSGTMSQISIQDDASNFTPSGDAYYDLIYVDTGTWARVYLSTYSSLADSRRFLQPYSSWATDSITITQEWGDVSGGSTMYAYVCDDDNSCSSSYEIGQAEASGYTATGSMPVGDFTAKGSMTFK